MKFSLIFLNPFNVILVEMTVEKLKLVKLLQRRMISEGSWDWILADENSQE